MTLTIRKATAEEMLALWGYGDAVSASPTARFFYERITGGSAVFWALDDGGELVGELYAFYDLDDKDFADGETTAYLCAFRVKKELRGKGHGSRLMEAALAELKEKGFKYATIGAEYDKPQNVRLYRRMGFDRKVKDCHYDPCGLDKNEQPLYDETAWQLLIKEL